MGQLVNAQIDLETGISLDVHAISIFNDIDSPLPLTVQQDDNRDLIEFHPESFKITSGFAPGYYLNGKFRGGFYFGTKARIQVQNVQVNGLSNYTDDYYTDNYGTLSDYLSNNPGSSESDYNSMIDGHKSANSHAFSIRATRINPFLELTFGYRFNAYKSTRPFVELNAGFGLAEMSIRDKEVDHPGFFVDPDFFTALSISSSTFVMRPSFGIEVKNYKFYGTLSIPMSKESLFSSTDINYINGVSFSSKTSLPYDYFVQFELGVGRRFQTPLRKKDASYGHVKDLTFLYPEKRDVKHWEFGINGGYLFKNMDIDDEIELVSLTEEKRIINGVERDGLAMERAQINDFIIEKVRSLPHLGFYSTAHLGNWFIQGEVAYTNVQIKQETQINTGYYVRQSNGTYYFDNSSYQGSSDAFFEKSFHMIPTQINVGWRREFGFFIGTGWQFLLPTSNFRHQNEVNSAHVIHDFNLILNGDETPETMQNNYINRGVNYFRVSDAEDYLEEVQQDFQTFENSDLRKESLPIVAQVVDLGFSFTSKRVTARMDIQFSLDWKGRTIFDGLFAMGGSVQYMLWGR